MARGHFHHIDLTVSDVAAAKEVYGCVLEFLGYRMVKDEPDGCEWDLPPSVKGGSNGASLGIKACHPGLCDRQHDRYAPGLHHLAWRADSRADVDRLHALLVERGVTITDPPAHYPEYWGDYYALFFTDPDGIKLELVHAPGWI